jgi:hypothetical protein
LLASSHYVINFGHRFIAALQISNMLFSTISREEKIVLLRSYVMSFDDINWEFIKDAYILVFDLTAGRFCMV